MLRVPVAGARGCRGGGGDHGDRRDDDTEHHRRDVPGRPVLLAVRGALIKGWCGSVLTAAAEGERLERGERAFGPGDVVVGDRYGRGAASARTRVDGEGGEPV